MARIRYSSKEIQWIFLISRTSSRFNRINDAYIGISTLSTLRILFYRRYVVESVRSKIITYTRRKDEITSIACVYQSTYSYFSAFSIVFTRNLFLTTKRSDATYDTTKILDTFTQYDNRPIVFSIFTALHLHLDYRFGLNLYDKRADVQTSTAHDSRYTANERER